MKKNILLTILSIFFLTSCDSKIEKTQNNDTYVTDNYTKKEVDIVTY